MCKQNDRIFSNGHVLFEIAFWLMVFIKTIKQEFLKMCKRNIAKKSLIFKFKEKVKKTKYFKKLERMSNAI